MIKLSTYALTLALLTHKAQAVDDDGICSGSIATIVGGLSSCTWVNFQTAVDKDCNLTAIFGADPQAEVEMLCAYDAPTQFVEIQGTYQKDKRYFAGGGPLVDGENWAIDSGKIQRFAANMGENTFIAWPEYAARIDYNSDPARGLGENGYPANMNLDVSCELKTAMCCFTDESMGVGFATNGDAPTDVCSHDLHDSPQSNFIKEGWAIYPGTETDTHCVGFTWTDEETDLIGNMMYDISLGNTATKGYRGGIPGAPMCGCVEHMPTVASAECRTASAGDITYTFDLDADTNEVSASNSMAVTYSGCGDLADAYKAKFTGDAVAQAKIDTHLAGDCAPDLEEYLNEEQFLHQGQHVDKYIVPDDTKWSELVVGEGIYFQPPAIKPYDADSAFRALVDPSLVGGTMCGGADPRLCIIRRVCASCKTTSHRDVFYRRISDLPPALPEFPADPLVPNPNGEVYFLDIFMNRWMKDYNENMVDFLLFSTYAEAVEGDETKAWKFCDYNHVNDNNYGFPRNCGPNYLVGNEWNSYVRGGAYADHHGFYVELP